MKKLPTLVMTQEGWILYGLKGETLAGPGLRNAAIDLAKTNNIEFKELPIMLDGLKEGTLFQTPEGWYRLIEIENDGYHCLNVDTQKKEILQPDVKITAISILHTN